MTDKQKAIYRLYFRDFYNNITYFTAGMMLGFFCAIFSEGWNIYFLVFPLSIILYLIIYLLYHYKYVVRLAKAVKDVKNDYIDKASITVSTVEFENRMKLRNHFLAVRKKVAVTDVNGEQYFLTFCKQEFPFPVSLERLIPLNSKYEVDYLRESRIVVEIHPLSGFNRDENEGYLKLFSRVFDDPKLFITNS